MESNQENISLRGDGFVTARERVLASRLVQKIDNNEHYARQIGLSCAVSSVGTNNKKSIQIKEKKN